MNEKELLSNEKMLKQRDKSNTDDEDLDRLSDVNKYKGIELCIISWSEEIRLDVLKRIVESKKSTLRFTRTELDLLLLFLKYNLCERMDFIRFIKMALKRFKASLAVMQRQLGQELKMRHSHEEFANKYYEQQDIDSETHKCALALSHQRSEQIKQEIKDYTTFFINLHEICVNNLYPDATYNRKSNSLQILLLMQDLLCDEYKDIEWREEQAEMIFQSLLLDTYESNKEMAYQILKTMNPTLLHLDLESHVKLLIEVALILGNSIRPIDSVTAAYILKISMLSPVIRNVLHNDYHTKDTTYANETIALQLMLVLYRKLHIEVISVKKNMGMITVHSLYGYVFCIKSLLDDYDLSDAGTSELYKAIAYIIFLCSELNNTVSVVVNNSSPEGHLPMDLKKLNFKNNLSPEKEIITSQKILLCSWRSVKEISQLFGFFATKASITTNESEGLLLRNQIEEIMELLVSLLFETKHRGAFEQAYVGFHQVCTRVWRLTNTTLNRLPLYYLHDILIGITGLTPKFSKLCSTRRSAGVPFMIQAVLSSEPKAHDDSKSAFHSVMNILLQFLELEDTTNLRQKVKCIMYKNTIFSDYKYSKKLIINNTKEYHTEIEPSVTEIKTHSMNILRALFRHSELRDMVKNYIAQGLMVAFRNYDNETWAERNAATLLFSALIVRIFGVQRTKDHINLDTNNKMTQKTFFERYPSLLHFILHELRTFVLTDFTLMKAKVQAILLLLSRLYVNYDSEERDVTSKTSQDQLVDFVSQCAISPVYETRQLAARALVPFLTKSTTINVVEKLIQDICSARDTRISANMLHGYLLQILEILRKLPSIYGDLQCHMIQFFNETEWILKNLERKSNEFTCFLIATVYVDILHELYRSDEYMIKKFKISNLERILDILQEHLIETDLLKQGPGEQMYKVSVIKFLLCVGQYSNILRTVSKEKSKVFHIYSQLLISPDDQLQSVAWTTISKVLNQQLDCREQRRLSTYAIRTVTDFTENLFKDNPELQDAIFDFLYTNLLEENEYLNDNKREICRLVIRKIHSYNASDIYSQRVSYLRLLGKCMATLIHELKDEEFSMEFKEDVYRKVCDYDWISSLREEQFRSSVFEILYDLFNDDIDPEHCHPMLDWWTMLLQLLIDDNADVRTEALFELMHKRESKELDKLDCIERTLPAFFQKFSETIADKYPGIAISALFCWSVSLLGDTDYEMNETDVFNKSRNYDVFEPVKISGLCFDLTKLITQRYSIDSALPPDVVRWINYRLDIDFPALSSFKSIVHYYMNNVPKLERKLEEIIDPTYKDKLLQILACEKYASLCDSLNVL